MEIQPVRTTVTLCILALIASGHLIGPVSGSHILLVPYTHQRTSRLLNMMKIGQMMLERNHTVAMLLSSNSIPRAVPDGIRLIPFQLDIPPFEISSETFLHEFRKDPFVFASGWIKYSEKLLTALFGNKDVLHKLVSENFDLVFMDIISAQAYILRDYLNVPGVGYSNLGFSSDFKTFAPLNPTYVPSSTGPLSDTMNFWERLSNTLSVLGTNYAIGKMTKPFHEAKVKYNLNASLSLSDAYTRVSITIVNADFVFDYPRAVMPWVKPVTGLLFHPANPLQGDLKSFVESSGEAGIIILSFGTMIAELESETTTMMARVFARLPQKVIWRNANSNIEGIGNNTKVLPWIPQNDLLGHKKTRLFITHCGISSAHEALFHGVPVVAVPLFFDQFSHSRKLVERIHMGQELDFYNLTEHVLEDTINSVLTNPTYSRNAKRASKLVRDQPMDGKEVTMFWIEYMIRNKGTLHFHSQAMERLNWFQYLLLDVLAFILMLIVCVVIMVVVLCRMVRCIYRKICSDKKMKKE